MPHSVIGGIVYSVTPTILVGLIFWFAMRAIFRADRTERSAYTEIEAEERARAEAEELSGRVVPTAPASAARDA